MHASSNYKAEKNECILTRTGFNLDLYGRVTVKVNNIAEPEFLNIYCTGDFSRRAVFSKVRVYSRAHSGYNFVCLVF
jgi:hypothetical protein